MKLRIIYDADRPGDVDPRTAMRLVDAILPSSPLLQSIGADKTALSVHHYHDPTNGAQRYALALMSSDAQLVVADSSAKRHVYRAYRELVELGEEGHIPTSAAPHAWDHCDVPGVPANVEGRR